MGPMNGLNAFERQNPSDRSRADGGSMFICRDCKTERGIVFLQHRGQPIRSAALTGPMSRNIVHDPDAGGNADGPIDERPAGDRPVGSDRSR
jgi:hypothetical protein